jgi:Sulfotransferase domain
MHADAIRIAMWSGPRALSTAMMRSFGARPDTAVVDEPFYAAYLAATGLEHPMRAEVLASQPQDWRAVVAQLLGRAPEGKPIWYQKHMTHHMLDSFGHDWIAHMRNAFLIRDPEAVLASYVQKREDVTLADIGIVRQHELFQREAARLGAAPAVVEGNDILANPAGVLRRLCETLEIPYTDAMLTWPAGSRHTDGVWAPAWYQSVERSTGFAPAPVPRAVDLPSGLRRIADQARPYYDSLAAYKL